MLLTLQQNIIMGNIKNINNVPVLRNTVMDNGDDSTTLIIPKEFAKELQIENSKVLLSLVDDYEGNTHLLISKFHREIVID
jgi:hypothetical protein